MTDAVLQFDAARHIYALGARRLPSVTMILHSITEQEYRAVRADVMEAARQLGHAVHALIELECAGTLDEDALNDSLKPYLAMWRQFCAQSGFEPLVIEQRVHSARYGFAGTLDLYGRLNGRLALIDAKRCAKVPRSAGPQTAAYEIAVRECLPVFASGIAVQPIDRFALHLTPDRWQLVPFRDPNDARVFLSALTLHNFMEQAA